MRFRILLLAVGCLLSAVSAQWLETTILLPDSFGPQPCPSSLLYNPANNTVYAGGGQIVVRDGTTLERVAAIAAPADQGLCYNPQNNKVYCTGAGLDSITVIDGATNLIVTRVPAGIRPGALCYNPLSNKVYCANQGSGTVTVVDGATNLVAATVTVESVPRALSYNPQRNKVYCSGSGETTVIDGASDSVIATVAGTGAAGASCYNPASNKLYCGGGHSVFVVDGNADTLAATVSLDYWNLSGLCSDPLNNRILCAVWWRDGTRGPVTYAVGVINGITSQIDTLIMYVGPPVCFNDQTNKVYWPAGSNLSIRDGTTYTLLAQVPTGGASALCFSPQADRIFCANSNAVTAVDGATDQLLAWTPLRADPSALCLDSTAAKLYCANPGGSYLSVIDGAANRVLAGVKVGFGPTALCWNSRQNRVYSANSGSNSVSVIDAVSDTVIAVVGVGRNPSALCHNPQDDKVYCANPGDHSYPGSPVDSTVTVIAGATNEVVATIVVGVWPSAVLYNPVGDKVYAYSGDNGSGTVTVIDGATDSIRTTIPVEGIGGMPVAFCYNPVHNKLYCASRYAVRVIDGAGDTLRARLGVSGGPHSLYYNPVSDRLYCTNEHSAYVTVIDGARDLILFYVPVEFTVRDMHYEPRHNKVYCRSDNSIYVMNGAMDTIITVIAVGDGPRGVLSLPELDRVFVANSGSSSISVIRDSATGIAEGSMPASSGTRSGPTVVRGVLELPRKSGTVPAGLGTVPIFALLDISGRKVLDLHPGANDVSRLAPGVYFVRAVSRGPSAVSCRPSDVRKVVIQR